MPSASGAEWVTVPFGSLAEFKNGLNYSKANFGKGMKVIGVADFQDRLFPDYSHLEEIDPAGVVRDRDLLQENDLLFVRSNGNRDLIGRSLLLRRLPERLSHSGFTIRARTDSTRVLPLFIAYFFRSDLARRHLSLQGGGTNISNLNQQILAEFPVPLPPFPAQRKIAAILSVYDDLIENNLRRMRILEEMAQALYREWFVEFRFPGHERVTFVESPNGKAPAMWEACSLTDLADVLSGGTPRTGVPEYWDGDIPFFTPRDSHGGFYVFSTEKTISQRGLESCNSRLYPKDTVFVTARGTVGNIAMPTSGMAMNQSCYALAGRGVGQRFLFLCLKDRVDHLKRNTGGATFDTIVVDTFRRIPALRPPEGLVARFESLVAPLFERLPVLLAQNRNLRMTRDLLLPRLISGELDVSGLDIAVPEALA